MPAANFDGCFLLSAILLITAALAFIRRGLSSRVGVEPHCARCDYTLLGLPLAVCPECGTTLTRQTRRIGRRRRRPAVATIGVVLLLLASFPIAMLASPRLRAIDWYHHRPASWVLDELDSAHPDTRVRAARELHRRLNDAHLSARRRSFLHAELFARLDPDRARKYHFMPDDRGPFADALACELLGHELLFGRLSKQQHDDYFSLRTRPGLAVRSQVIWGEELPYRLEMRGGTSLPDGLDVEGVVEQARISGKPADPVYFNSPYEHYSPLTGSHRVPHLGHQTLELDVVHTAYFAPKRKDSTPIWSKRYRLSASFVVVHSRDSLFVLRDEPSLTAKLAECFKVALTRPETGGVYHGTAVIVRSVPCNVAFEMFVRIGEEEHSISRGVIELGDGESSAGIVRLPHILGDKVDVVVRSDPARARKTVHLMDAWSGEFVIPDVPVTDE